MKQRWRSLAFPFLLSVAPSLAASNIQSFENSAIVRTVELGGSLVHVTTTYAAKALQPNANVYTIALGDEEVTKTSWLELKIKGQAEPLEVKGHGVEPNGLHLLDVVLPKALSLNSTVNIVLETVQTHATWPWPETAEQKGDQLLKYATDLFVLSPYHTHVQRTKLKSPSPHIESFTTPEGLEDYTLDSPVTKSGATVTYGPYNDVPAASNDFVGKHQQRLTVHYKSDFPVLEVTTLTRTAEISHWGANLNIEDHINLRNAGPALKGHFSRLDHQTLAFYKRSAPHVLPSLTLHLPAGIKNTYYYDLIGNVSTSRLRTVPKSRTKSLRPQYSVLELRPRYPLMGGWNYSFTLGWDSPLADSASYNKETGRYIVQVPVMTEIPTAVVDKAEIKIILPEGATDIEYVAPFPPMLVGPVKHVTYLDTKGRPAIFFMYKDLTDKHTKPIYVTYRVPLSAHFRKPIAVATAFFAVFSFALVARRINYTIHKVAVKV